ncbi:transmembrane protein 138 isoform X2 [Pipistrellus kuhlii]|uniref:transmembrane protein 138 isoform X2 n=1 Tax=Pipistrellus kuhlii TaxID=59472 RepID=UPI001E270B6F|nr:transmembrane protein 138 isoform X2 [Pipistrellus kuhlii]
MALPAARVAAWEMKSGVALSSRVKRLTPIPLPPRVFLPHPKPGGPGAGNAAPHSPKCSGPATPPARGWRSARPRGGGGPRNTEAPPTWPPGGPLSERESLLLRLLPEFETGFRKPGECPHGNQRWAWRLLSSVKGTSLSVGPVRAAFWGTGECALGAGQRRKMLQASGYSLVLSLQLLLLTYDLFVNSFSELLRSPPVIQLVLFIIQDIAILFNIIVIFLMFFNTFVFQAGLVSLLFHKFKGTIVLTAVYFALSIALHVWLMNLRWKDSNRFVWTEGLQALFVFQRLAPPQERRPSAPAAAVFYCYFYKRTAVRLGDPRFYQDSAWLRKEFTQVRR